MKQIIVCIASAILGAFFTPASAQFAGYLPSVSIQSPLVYRNQACNLPMTRAYSEFLTTSGAYIGDVCMVTPTSYFQQNGLAVSSRVDMAGKHGKAVGAYFSAEGFGEATSTPGGYGGEVVGLYSRVEPHGNHWTTAIHGECRNQSRGPGLCMGLNIELNGNEREAGPTAQHFIGINVQPDSISNGRVVGMQFQHPEKYIWAIDVAGAPIKLGQTHDVGFCMVYKAELQKLQFVRGCGAPGAVVAHEIDLGWQPGMKPYK